MANESLVLVGTLLIIVGIVLAFITLSFPALKGQSKSQGGAVVIIGPFPIIFGTNRRIAKSLLILAILLVVSLIAFFLLRQFLLFQS